PFETIDPVGRFWEKSKVPKRGALEPLPGNAKAAPIMTAATPTATIATTAGPGGFMRTRCSASYGTFLAAYHVNARWLQLPTCRKVNRMCSMYRTCVGCRTHIDGKPPVPSDLRG